jgi:hypothetical protein
MESLIRRQIEEAATHEWPAHVPAPRDTDNVPAALAEALQLALALESRTDGQVAAQREIAVEVENALDARRQRIIVSESTVNWVKWATVLLQACAHCLR